MQYGMNHVILLSSAIYILVFVVTNCWKDEHNQVLDSLRTFLNCRTKEMATDSDNFDEEECESIVCDIGGYAIKAGFSGDDTPRKIFRSVIAKNHGATETSRELSKDLNGGDEEHKNKDTDDVILSYPIKHGIIQSWDEMEIIWHHMFNNELRVQPEEYSILNTEAALSPKLQREKITKIMFETFNVPSQNLMCQSVLSCYAAGKTTGFVIDCGYDQTQCVPIYEGYVLPHGVLKNKIGGKNVTEYLMKIMDENLDIGAIRDIKEKSGFYIDEYGDYDNSKDDKSIKYQLPDGREIKVTSKMRESPEILFKPELINDGIGKMVYDAIFTRCDENIVDELVGNIILSGGNSLFDGFDKRLYKEIAKFMKCGPDLVNGFVRRYNYNQKILYQDITELITKYLKKHEAKIISPANRKYSAWIGGSIITSISTFQEAWITKSEYNSAGPGIVHRKCF